MPSSTTSIHNSNNNSGCLVWSLDCGPGAVLGTL